MKNGEIVYSLSSWTIREQLGKFFIAKTQHWNGKHEWSKAYSSLQHACNAIARSLQREWPERQGRQVRFQRRLKKKAA